MPTIKKTNPIYLKRDGANGYLYPSVLTDKVGIGTATPITKLDIAEVAIATPYTNCFKVGTGTKNNSYGNAIIFPSSTTAGYYSKIAGRRGAAGAGANDLVFMTGKNAPQERMIIFDNGNVRVNDLTASKGVYTDASKNFTSTPPTSGDLGFWNRTGTTISPATSGDGLDMGTGDYNSTGLMTIAKPLTGIGGTVLTASFTGTSDGTNAFDAFSIAGRNAITGTNWVKENSFAGLEFMGSFGILAIIGNSTVKTVGARVIGHFGFASIGNFNDIVGVESYTTSFLNATANATNGISSFVGQSIGNAFPTYTNNVGQLVAIPQFGTNNYQQILQGRGTGTGMFTGGYLLQPVIKDVKNSDFISSTPNWTNTDSKWSLIDLGFSNYAWKHATGSTTKSELTSAYMETGSIKSGKKYRIRIRLSGRTAGSVRVNLGTATGTYRSDNGPYIEELTANADDVSLFIEPTSTFDGALDYVLIYPLEEFDYARVYSPNAGQLNLAVESGGSEIDILELTADDVTANKPILLSGDGKVYKNQWINVQGLKAPGTKPASAVDWGISCGWEFSDGTDDTICSSIRLPQDMDRTVAPELKIGFASDTNTGDVVWQLEYLYLSPNEDTTASAQETLTTTTTISGTADGLTIATITGMDLPSSTDQLVKMRIKRLGADGDDTLGDVCVLVGVGLKYVADKLGVAI